MKKLFISSAIAVTVILSAFSVKADNMAYMAVYASGDFGTIDLDTGTFSLLGNSGQTPAGLDVANSTLYMASIYGSGSLYTVNLADGSLTLVGSSGISYDDFGSTTQGLYAVGSDTMGTINSSARCKDSIKPMDKTSEAIFALKPVTFRYKHELDPAGIPQFGLVAEQVEKVNPDLVARDDQGKPYTVRYEAVNAMLLNEFLKEHRKVEALPRGPPSAAPRISGGVGTTREGIPRINVSAAVRNRNTHGCPKGAICTNSEGERPA